MTVLSSKQVLQEKNTTDPNSITSLTLTHKALSDVSCLSEFKNLEKLDLAFNSLTSLEGLKSCVNLKWLSVVQNKLQSLKGIEGLTNLTVLNAGKNELRSMDEVRSVASLRALILNDNEIVSLCMLDQMKELNTLVLSRNPIRKIDGSLAMTKSITKLSLSDCQLETIDSSLKSCTELKELRLAHNEIKNLPDVLARNVRLQTLDLGNNSIIRWSDVKVLSSLVNLRNLNLQGNPIAEKEKSIKKIKKLLPNLQILNAKPLDNPLKNEKGGRAGDSSFLADRKQVVHKEDQTDNSMGNKVPKHHIVSQSETRTEDAEDVDRNKKRNSKKQERSELPRDSASDQKVDKTIIKSKAKKESKMTEEKQNGFSVEEAPSVKPDLQRGLVTEKGKIKQLSRKGASDHKENIGKKVKQDFDDEIPLEEIIAASTIGYGKNSIEDRDVDMVGGLVSYPKKKKKVKSEVIASSALHSLTAVPEVGLGGPSAWGE